jgi:hypothetical protein
MSTTAPSAHAPRFGTVAALSLIALTVIAAIALQVVSANDVAGVYGWNTGPDGATVTSVTPGYPASKAGIQPGDVVDYRNLNLLGRLNTVLPQALYAGAPLTVRFVRFGVQHTVTMTAAPTGGFHARNYASIVSGLLIIAVGAFLVVLRPSRMTWGFLLMGIGQLSVALIYRYGSPMLLWSSSLVRELGLAVGWAGLLMFVSRFPNDSPQGWLKALDRVAIPAAALYFALEAYIAAVILFSIDPPAAAVQVIAAYAYPALISFTALVALIAAGLSARGNARQRLVPVIATFTLWSAISAADLILPSLYTTPFVLYYLPFLGCVALALFAFATAYGTVRHRVIDVSFIVSRTLVYTLITAILIGTFAIVDILVARWLESSQLAIILELAVAVLMGVWLKSMHHRVDAFVDSVLFRRRHLAERRLERAAKTLPHATSAAFVNEALVVEPTESLGLVSSALFRRNSDGTFERRFALGWSDGSALSLESDDHLVIQLEAELDCLNLSDVRWPRADIPSGLYQPLLAVPIIVRHRLVAFALYGGHVGGEALDPDEIRSLRQLAMPAGAAYDHLEAEELREQNDRLRTLSAELQLDKQVNAGAIELMRRQMAAIDELLQQRRLTAE